MILRSIFTIFILISCWTLAAQDPIFTQSNYIQETLNPAFSGFEDNDRLGAGILSRVQWPNLDLQIHTQYAYVNKSYDYGPSLGFGIGMNAVWQYESFNNYNYAQVNFNYAHRINLNNGWYFRPAIEAGIGNKSNRFRNLTLADQININSGFINPVSVDPLAGRLNNIYFLDINAGFLVEKQTFDDISYWIGGSVRHLNRPNISIVDGEKLPLDIFYSFHGNVRFPFLRENTVMMTTNLMVQGPYNRLDVGTIFQLDALLLGLTAATNPARNDGNEHLLTSINAFVGFEYETLRFGFSYDKNTSNIGRTDGVYELSMTYLSRCQRCSTDRSRKR
ncbi:PorP/SprF family type IX secretion system membrane protein [Winogradskyella aquimaris]|uniref:PorP/SprF family type IX secretion system membrane protein n=1 Tax=Winogradskyella aquimaris TaxID=864074 RepID=A0ABU5EK77_9FLAO|nr:PorP/SprF family type IX secretion system membrane protein [Winogradskyella aquimaris]MDY2586776.1 PorP/SprF family type IX secretion system membrane protein [Winogradskyella aquimaris]